MNSADQGVLLVLLGGASSEHGVSCLSGGTVAAEAARAGLRVRLGGIDRAGQWTHLTEAPAMGAGLPVIKPGGDRLTLAQRTDGVRLMRQDSTGALVDEGRVWVVFPALHGINGDDGSVQGLCEMLGVPYVGADPTACAVMADKRLTKAVFAANGLPQVAYRVVSAARYRTDPGTLDDICAFGAPVVVKSTGGGAGAGTWICADPTTVAETVVRELARHEYLLVEAFVPRARELECVVILDDQPTVTGPGEIVYARTERTVAIEGIVDRTITCPAPVDPEIAEACRRLTVEACRAVGATGLARVDFFLDEQRHLMINEITAMPGLQPGSMALQLWESAGLAFSDVIGRLTVAAIGRRAGAIGS